MSISQRDLQSLGYLRFGFHMVCPKSAAELGTGL